MTAVNLGLANTTKKQTLPRQSAHILDFLTILWENVKKERACSAGTLSNKNSDRPAQKCFRCGSKDHIIAKFTKPPKGSEKRRKSDISKEKGNSAKGNSDDDGDLKLYASMAGMSNDDERKNKDYGDSS